ncbi:hypothetical protein VTK73DRAFT_7252 [Phialemonium thermophilum]|uniref:Uncharacterized protein n=1 Tax=Phialemonium thermophilum TaxID=223376 RepID=A0ABR3XU68_9PEZI
MVLLSVAGATASQFVSGSLGSQFRVRNSGTVAANPVLFRCGDTRAGNVPLEWKRYNSRNDVEAKNRGNYQQQDTDRLCGGLKRTIQILFGGRASIVQGRLDAAEWPSLPTSIVAFWASYTVTKEFSQPPKFMYP